MAQKRKAEKGIQILELGMAEQRGRPPLLQQLRSKRDAEAAELLTSLDKYRKTRQKHRDTIEELQQTCKKLDKSIASIQSRMTELQNDSDSEPEKENFDFRAEFQKYSQAS